MITFGILGTANIAYRFLRGANKCEQVRVEVVGSRSLAKAQAFVKAAPKLRGVGTYEEVWNDPSIDAIYLATPNFTHYDLIMRSLQAGKHVLCEKPLLLHAHEVKTCFAYAKAHGLLLMEGMKPAFLPTTLQAKAWIQQGEIGQLRLIRASYCHDHVSAFLSGWHSDINQGGGVLYDIGVYPMGFVHAILPLEPTDLKIQQRFLQKNCDCFDLLTCRYQEVLVELLCGCDTPMHNEALIYGSKGTIRIKDFWKSDTAILCNAQGEQVFTEAHEQSEFQYEIREFCKSIEQKQIESPLMGEEDSLRNARMIDEIIAKGAQYE